MLKSRVFTIPIHRRYADVYGFLAEPTNFALWGGTEPDTEMKHLGGSDYLGVLDYQVFMEGETNGPVTPVRIHHNQDGSEIVFTWFQRPGVSDEQFESEAEWAYSDLLRMKAYIEAR